MSPDIGIPSVQFFLNHSKNLKKSFFILVSLQSSVTEMRTPKMIKTNKQKLFFQKPTLLPSCLSYKFGYSNFLDDPKRTPSLILNSRIILLFLGAFTPLNPIFMIKIFYFVKTLQVI